MRTLGKAMDDHLAGVTRQLPEDALMDKQGVSCDADIYASQVFLDFRSPLDSDNPARPYMHIMGECRAIRGDIPCGVNEIRFEEGAGIPVDIFYEFADEELSEMVLKGMYRKGFECPDIIRTSCLEMPVFCNFKVVVPQTENDVPVVFADIADRRTIEVSEETCGYRFGSYFEEPRVEETFLGDDFDVYGDYDLQDDMFRDEQEHEVEETVEAEHEPTEDERRLAEHYANIRERVVKNHLLVKRETPKREAVPHKDLTRIEKEEPAKEVEAIMSDASVEAEGIMFEDESAMVDAGAEVVDAFEADTDVETEVVEDDGMDDFEDFDDEDAVEDSVEEALADEEDKRSESANKRRIAIGDNIEANAEDDATHGGHRHREVPAHMRETAERLEQERQTDVEYDD